MSRGDKHIDLAGHPGVRVRIERLDGNPLARRTDGVPWWDREQIAFLVQASPMLASLKSAEVRVLAALTALDLWRAALSDGPPPMEVVMFHGCFLKCLMWCPPGTASKLGIKT